MPPKFDKLARTFQLYPRSHTDPLNHTEDGPVGVFYETEDLNSREAKQARKPRVFNREELENMHDEFVAEGRRENEGEAALYGITFDDSQYDYMQHLRPIGQYQDAYFVGRDGKVSESYIPPEANGRDTLQDLLNGNTGKNAPQATFQEHYQSQLPVQDAIAGLQPNMDPRLREVLEALEDEEYVENDDEDIFSELIKTGEMKNADEWKLTAERENPQELIQREDEADWEFAFRKFKLKEGSSDDEENEVGSDFGGSLDILSQEGLDSDLDELEERDVVGALKEPSKGVAAKKAVTKKKKRIGAKTDLSGYSMSSSANYRNEGLSLLDDKFDLVEEQYAKRDEPVEQMQFDLKKERSDLDSIMDDFLDKYVVEGKHLVKKVK